MFVRLATAQRSRAITTRVTLVEVYLTELSVVNYVQAPHVKMVEYIALKVGQLESACGF